MTSFVSHFSFPQTHVQNDVYFPHLFGAGILFGTGYVLTSEIMKRVVVQIFGDHENLSFRKYIHSSSYQVVINDAIAFCPLTFVPRLFFLQNEKYTTLSYCAEGTMCFVLAFTMFTYKRITQPLHSSHLRQNQKSVITMLPIPILTSITGMVFLKQILSSQQKSNQKNKKKPLLFSCLTNFLPMPISIRSLLQKLPGSLLFSKTY